MILMLVFSYYYQIHCMLLLHVSLELMRGTYAGFAIYIYRYIRANRCFVSDIDAAEIQLASNVLTLLTGYYKERISIQTSNSY